MDSKAPEQRESHRRLSIVLQANQEEKLPPTQTRVLMSDYWGS